MKMEYSELCRMRARGLDKMRNSFEQTSRDALGAGQFSLSCKKVHVLLMDGNLRTREFSELICASNVVYVAVRQENLRDT
jgi:hypothetical protein